MLAMLLFSASLAGSAVCEDEADATGSYIVTNTPRMRSQRSASATSERSYTSSYLCESYPGPQAFLVRSDYHLHIRVYNIFDFMTSVDKLL